MEARARGREPPRAHPTSLTFTSDLHDSTTANTHSHPPLRRGRHGYNRVDDPNDIPIIEAKSWEQMGTEDPFTLQSREKKQRVSAQEGRQVKNLQARMPRARDTHLPPLFSPPCCALRGPSAAPSDARCAVISSLGVAAFVPLSRLSHRVRLSHSLRRTSSRRAERSSRRSRSRRWCRWTAAAGALHSRQPLHPRALDLCSLISLAAAPAPCTLLFERNQLRAKSHAEHAHALRSRVSRSRRRA